MSLRSIRRPRAATVLLSVVLALAICPLALGQGVPGGPDPIPQAPDPVPQAPAPTPTPAPRPSTPAPSAPATPATPVTPATPETPAGPTPAQIKAQKAAEARARAAEKRRKAEALRLKIAAEKRRQAAEKRQEELSTLSVFSDTLGTASTRVGKVRLEVPATGVASPSASDGAGSTIPLLLVLAALVCGTLAVLPSMVARRDPRLSHNGGLVAVATHRMELTAVAASCLLIALFIIGLN